MDSPLPVIQMVSGGFGHTAVLYFGVKHFVRRFANFEISLAVQSKVRVIAPVMTRFVFMMWSVESTPGCRERQHRQQVPLGRHRSAR